MPDKQSDAYDLDTKIDEFLTPHTVKKEKKHKSTNKNKLPEEVLPEDRFKPDPKYGLTGEQVLIRQSQYQCNVKGRQYSKSIGKIICSNLFTFFNLLCVVCLAALLFVNSQAKTPDEKVGIFNFTFVVIYGCNLAIGIIQEIKAKKTIEKLSLLNEPVTHVVRNGENTDIPVNEIVLDDVVRYSTGNQISVDGTLLSGMLEVNESILTGESVPVKKKVGDRVLAGSFVVSGNALIVADKVGESRYIQQLSAKAKKYKKPSSELMSTLTWIIRVIGILIIPISIGVLLTNKAVLIANPISRDDKIYAVAGKLTQLGVVEMVKRTTSVILGMIPSGMFLLTTLALAVGVIRLAGKNTSVQDMYALEMLARVDVLCLDKTGTITDGRMKVSNCVLFKSDYKYTINDIVSSMQYALEDNNQTSTALRAYFGSEKKISGDKDHSLLFRAEIFGRFVFGRNISCWLVCFGRARIYTSQKRYSERRFKSDKALYRNGTKSFNACPFRKTDYRRSVAERYETVRYNNVERQYTSRRYSDHRMVQEKRSQRKGNFRR